MRATHFYILTACAIAMTYLSAGAVESPTMGWSSWNTYRVNISEDIICRQADAMSNNGLREAGYTYINIDDGFFGGRDAEGNLLFHPQRFPNGLRPVVDHIHSLGFKAGIYSDAGRNTCGNFWDNDKTGTGVGLYGHDSIDAKLLFVDLGFDFIKIDFCGGDAAQNHEQLELDERERYSAIRRTINNAGRPDVRINVCRWAFPGTWVRDIGSSWRIAPDISADWNSIKRIIDANTYLSAYAGQGHYNDMDMLEIGRGLSDAEERTHFGMWCIMSSPLLIGCDMTKIPNESLALITNPELIAVNQDTLGLQAYCVKEQNGVKMFVKDIERLHGTTRAVALYNPTEQAATFSLCAVDADLDGEVRVRDLFARKDICTIETDATQTITVDAHDTALLRLDGQSRLERTLYEAETAWLQRFQDIGFNPISGYATYTPRATCSGGAMVSYLGNHPENFMEFRDVWSRNGGTYTLTIDYLSSGDSFVDITLNGDKTLRIKLPGDITTSDKIMSESITIQLIPGINTVRIANSSAWAPDIDCIHISR